jgi:hypothetical protein
VPVIAGLAVGVAFMIVLSLAIINPSFQLRYGHADNATEQDKIRIAEMLDKSKRLEPVSLFLKHYPFAHIGIYQYGHFSLDGDDSSDSRFRTTFVYSGSPITRIEYEQVKVNNHLISYHYPALWLTINEQGTIEEISLRCSIKHLGNPIGGQTLVQEYDVVVGLLNAKICWWA